jgi:hypothetical protein
LERYFAHCRPITHAVRTANDAVRTARNAVRPVDAGIRGVAGGIPAPVAGIPALVAGIPASVAGIPAPVAGIPAPVAGIPAPVAGIPAPVAGNRGVGESSGDQADYYPLLTPTLRPDFFLPLQFPHDMPSKDWLPKDSDDLALWFQNFLDHSTVLTTDLGIAAPEVATTTALATAWLGTHAEVLRLRRELAAAVLTEDTAREATNEPIRKLARQVKASPKATPALLELLQMAPVAATTSERVEAEKPVLKVSQGPNRIDIGFGKYGREGIRLFSKRGTETAFSVVGTFTTSPALDRRPNLLAGQAEQREYYAWYLEHDEPVGSQSDLAGIAAAPTAAGL